ncbi:uncharacterized protein LOC131235664 [Magnolia sinica]|uniref:uncharacterized protein LOC131235664 n=1 Tax=Magnolia sinica TaxID=86752 RepID=UPI00265A513C|nr:uncharacterized protein LOC131235664 [Magnolia sinica]
MFVKVGLVLVVGLLGWVYQSIQPPPPLICGSPNGPPVTSPRIKLRDGRYLAYKESGVPKEKATYKIVIVHGFGGSKDIIIPASPELVEELGIYFVAFDRPGYGESDPDPKRTIKSHALDVQDLADGLELGSRFYTIGISMGGLNIWGCLKYIPHRLAGAALVVPVVNYWWPSLPANLSNDAYKWQPLRDQWALRIAHHAPRILYWWMTQKWFPTSSVVERRPEIFSHQDKAILQKLMAARGPTKDNAEQQGVFESLHRDMMVSFGKWDFDPMDVKNPFPNKDGSVHLWQGYEDRLVPYTLQRYISKNLPWIQYHELPEGGHMLLHADGVSDAVLRALLLGEEPSIISG